MSLFDQYRDPSVLSQLGDWASDLEHQMIEWLWSGLDVMEEQLSDARPMEVEEEIERELCQKLYMAMQTVRRKQGGVQPFELVHEWPETETRKGGKARPPAYDLAFALYPSCVLLWPIEAKALSSAGAISDYLKSIDCRFRTCLYAPFSSGAAMLGFLSKDSPLDALNAIQQAVGLNFEIPVGFESRNHRVSRLVRQVPDGKPYTPVIRLHHLVFRWR